MNRLATGTRFARLSFVETLAQRSPDKHLVGLWECECGMRKKILISRVVHGHARSCGCWAKQRNREQATRHGMRGTRTYTSWMAMKRRCEDPGDKDFRRYGAVGIRVCAEWLGSFEAFFADMGERPMGTTLDRIDGTKGYAPGNCKWSTPVEQARNNRKFTLISSPLGNIPLIDYAQLIGISNGAAHLRLKRGKLKGCARL